MNQILRYKRITFSDFGFSKVLVFSCVFLLCSGVSNAQVKFSTDATEIKIGEQITYQIEVETDSTDLVVFPEGSTFSPLELIESYKIDTTKNSDRFNLIKKYGLTQFDSGAFTIPAQKIIINEKVLFTDSLNVRVNPVVLDTINQGLYDIKPIMSVEKSASNWWKTIVFILLALAVVAALLYWFVWRKKPLSEEEKIALLPPYDRAKLALQQLDEHRYLEEDAYKEYYSELTMAIRRYLDEKVYDRALESTTDELISRLRLLKDGNQIDLSLETIKNLESIFKRADLVKFAKSAPDKELAKLDRNTIDKEIDQVKAVLPEPNEEEKLLNEQYKEAQERKKKRRKIVISVFVVLGLLTATFIGFGMKYGFNYVKDTLFGNNSLELLEGNWVRSDYGFPPITITTPEVLKRIQLDSSKNGNAEVDYTTFNFGSLGNNLNITLNTANLKNQKPGDSINLIAVAEKSIQDLENKGVANIFVKNEKFVTPNNAEGLKTFGSANFPIGNSDSLVEGEYILLHFTAENVIQQIIIAWQKDDEYAAKMVERIVNSVELKPDAE
ncbi:protein BatD [Bizionia myxarmorum]|uniref:Protein BatD n=1 Tax=Bizionia myxarmorum TaxID=291186 RepID=A0A5D0RB71_9FLAO|nr:protein BatD [Bizionia myxarmorum]TYB78623.1 protein BatD [Bizionia myxarmorum]